MCVGLYTVSIFEHGELHVKEVCDFCTAVFNGFCLVNQDEGSQTSLIDGECA